MKNLKHILYTSLAAVNFTPADLEALLVQAREKNTQADVTGMLLYRNGSFMQVLEGPEESVDAIYASINKDARHKDIVTLSNCEIFERDFSEWAMAFNGHEGDHVEGLSDFLHPYRSKDEQSIPEGVVKKLLKRFREINKR